MADASIAGRRSARARGCAAARRGQPRSGEVFPRAGVRHHPGRRPGPPGVLRRDPLLRRRRPGPARGRHRLRALAERFPNLRVSGRSGAPGPADPPGVRAPAGDAAGRRAEGAVLRAEHRVPRAAPQPIQVMGTSSTREQGVTGHDHPPGEGRAGRRAATDPAAASRYPRHWATPPSRAATSGVALRSTMSVRARAGSRCPGRDRRAQTQISAAESPAEQEQPAEADQVQARGHDEDQRPLGAHAARLRRRDQGARRADHVGSARAADRPRARGRRHWPTAWAATRPPSRTARSAARGRPSPGGRAARRQQRPGTGVVRRGSRVRAARCRPPGATAPAAARARTSQDAERHPPARAQRQPRSAR